MQWLIAPRLARSRAGFIRSLAIVSQLLSQSRIKEMADTIRCDHCGALMYQPWAIVDGENLCEDCTIDLKFLPYWSEPADKSSPTIFRPPK